MTQESHQRAARLLADAWLARATIELPTKLLPPDRATAYAIQDEMARLLAAVAESIGAPSKQAVVGWKVGATSPGVQKAEGYDGPIPGRIFASTVFASPARLPSALCPYAKVEAEIAFRFRVAPKQGAQFSLNVESLTACVEALPAFDITSTRYAPSTRIGWNRQQNMLAGIADNGNSGVVVLGAPLSDWRTLDFMQLAVDLRVNGRDPAPNLWDDARGDPLAALLWTVNNVYERGFSLAAGDIVLTGSLIQPQPLHPGNRVVCHFPGLGSISCQIKRA